MGAADAAQQKVLLENVLNQTQQLENTCHHSDLQSRKQELNAAPSNTPKLTMYAQPYPQTAEAWKSTPVMNMPSFSAQEWRLAVLECFSYA